MSTLMSPAHAAHFRPLIQAGGGDASSEISPHHLYLSHGVQEHLLRVYDGLRGTDPVLSKAKFEEWLQTVQEQEGLKLDAQEYKFEQFLEAVYYQRGFEAIKEVGEKDLSKPLSNYYVSSSHNTYLSGNQLMSKSTTDAYKNVLIRGCRCIEIDVHNGEAPENKSSENLSQTFSNSPQPANKADHKRHISGSTLSSRAAAAFEKADEIFDKAKRKLADKLGPDSSSKKDDGGRNVTSSSLEVENPSGRPSSIRSAMSGEPLVLHGWTLTAPIGFRAVCKSIRESAFLTSKLPLIVSLEVHADLDQQEVMVDIMKEEWKGVLVDVPHEGCDPETRLPRLDELMEKILIKVKKAVADKQDLTPAPATLSPSLTKTDSESISGSEDERGTGKQKVKICENLSNLGIYTHSEHFIGFETKSATKPSHIYSIGENQIQELHETQKQAMFSHNRNFFMRAYPAGFRIDSSNVDPSEFWRKGVQMVALNWQKLDEGMMLNEGMFAGEHGWVLKPQGYRSETKESIDFQTLDLKITVLAGQHIPLPEDTEVKSFHPYVRCELHVEKEQEEGQEPLAGEHRKKKTGYQKGDHPNFGEGGSVIEFPTIRKVVEELSFVRFKIEDARYAKDDLAAWACIRLDRLQQGYRFVYLLDAKGQATPGLLLMKIEKKLAPCRLTRSTLLVDETKPVVKKKSSVDIKNGAPVKKVSTVDIKEKPLARNLNGPLKEDKPGVKTITSLGVKEDEGLEKGGVEKDVERVVAQDLTIVDVGGETKIILQSSETPVKDEKPVVEDMDVATKKDETPVIQQGTVTVLEDEKPGVEDKAVLQQISELEVKEGVIEELPTGVKKDEGPVPILNL
ncbi:related to 1-phosphatidylinositol-4,5-bisphosphate phosphodiesterase [Rhynchosporium graminicola]|uniref:Phosphoinositide phospholipase C n=1 Tax=Rhynchosporium graminicola TaxID=2792576 RepID=A0A1E1K4G5_9HELO|nr:related to 1-phosphatidylinositol-4,5-bisphosphate phosphodiesterase [Rhynchosporium commune]